MRGLGINQIEARKETENRVKLAFLNYGPSRFNDILFYTKMSKSTLSKALQRLRVKKELIVLPAYAVEECAVEVIEDHKIQGYRLKMRHKRMQQHKLDLIRIETKSGRKFPMLGEMALVEYINRYIEKNDHELFLHLKNSHKSRIWRNPRMKSLIKKATMKYTLDRHDSKKKYYYYRFPFEST